MQVAPASAALGDSVAVAPLQVFLVTFGPGARVWERYGHNAIWIHDPAAGTDLAYNWGMFSFDQPFFLRRILRGTMMYWMAPFPIDDMVSAYVAANRSIEVQELALTTAQKVELKEALALNALPENKFYRYDYYRDNCSTRVRDALDRVLGGRLRAALEGVPTGTSYRFHSLRLLYGMPAMYTSTQVILSHKADREIDRWEQSFLPIKLMESLRDVRVPDGSGGEMPLVVSEREIFRSTDRPEPATVPSHLLWYLGSGIAFALVLLLLARPESWARVPMAILAAGWSLLAAFAGFVLLGAWFFTDHVFWYPNENLLQLSPLSLGLAALVLPLLVRRDPPRSAVILAATVAGIAVLGCLMKLLPGLDQQNGEILAFTVPAHLAVLGALARLRAAARRTEPA